MEKTSNSRAILFTIITVLLLNIPLIFGYLFSALSLGLQISILGFIFFTISFYIIRRKPQAFYKTGYFILAYLISELLAWAIVSWWNFLVLPQIIIGGINSYVFFTSNVVLPIILSTMATILTFILTSRVLWPWEEKRERRKLFEKRKMDTLERIDQASNKAFVIYREDNQIFKALDERFQYEMVKREHLEPLYNEISDIMQVCTMAFEPLSEIFIVFHNLFDELTALFDQESLIEEGTAEFADSVTRIMYGAFKLGSLASRSLELMEPLSQFPMMKSIQTQHFAKWFAFSIKTQYGLRFFITDHEFQLQHTAGHFPLISTLVGFARIRGSSRPVVIMLVNATPYHPNRFCERISREEFNEIKTRIEKRYSNSS